jgi:GMP synthase (glutamine-hydrolysing)
MSSGRGTVGARVPDVVIWQADGAPLPGEGYGGRLSATFQQAGCAVAVVDYRRRGLSDRLLAAPVHVLSGGETSAFSQDRATLRARAQLAELARRAWSDDVTVVGICLGAQLLARAIAPELPCSTPERGMEAGWQHVDEEGRGPEAVAELHYEQIHPMFASIDGVTVTHRNEHSPVQAFRWGPGVVGMQFHPEWSPADLRVVLHRHRRLLAERHHDPRGAAQTLRGLRQRRPSDLFERLVVEPVRQRLATIRPLEVDPVVPQAA